MKTAIIAGATGLIGAEVLQLLLSDPSYSKVIAVTRKPLAIVDSKLQNVVLNFEEMATHAESLIGDDVFCCLGTTIKQAGSKPAFRKVDFEYPLGLAKITKLKGARQFLIITALGADKSSSIFYNQVKGEVEQAINDLGFESYHILQPSMLIGERKDERAAEGIGQGVMKFLDFLIPLKYKAIDSSKVARGMIAIARQNVTGRHVHSSGELQQF